MARSTPVHSGFTIVSGSGTGDNGNRIDVWVEYKIGTYSIVNNTTPFTAYFYAALASGKTSSTSATSGLNSTFTVNGTAGTTVSNGAYDFRSTSKVNLLGSYTGNIAHASDGKKTIKISGSFTTTSKWISGGNVEEFEVTLPTIPRASTITSAADVILGNKCNVKWTPHAASFRYKLLFSVGEWSYTTEIIHPNQTTAYTYSGLLVPMEVANQFTAKKGTATVKLYTYSDADGTNQIGTEDSETFTVTVPDNDDTKPVVSMELTEISPFEGIYLQRKSKVTAAINAEGQYGANIESYGLSIDRKSCDGLTSDYLTAAGTITVTGTATDSRGHTGKTEITIWVLAYDNPKILAVAAYRCDSEGNAASDGTYLRISATRNYSSVDGLNTCLIRYRYKEDGGEYGDWTPILEGDSESDSITTGALLSGSFDKTKAYIVQVGVVDTVGTEVSTTINIPSEAVYMHRPAGGKSMGLGGYVEEDDLLDVHWNQRVRKNFECDGSAVVEQDFTCNGEATFAGGLKVQGDALLNLVYPVGSIYMSVLNTSPATLFGGTWEQLKDRFLLGAGSTYTNGSAGGSATHTLAENEIPSHSHTGLYCKSSDGVEGAIDLNSGSTGYKLLWNSDAGKGAAEIYTGKTGGGKAHNNMPPYLVVYMWKRTA